MSLWQGAELLQGNFRFYHLFVSIIEPAQFGPLDEANLAPCEFCVTDQAE
jgi:hypothetical protein